MELHHLELLILSEEKGRKQMALIARTSKGLLMKMSRNFIKVKSELKMEAAMEVLNEGVWTALNENEELLDDYYQFIKGANYENKII